MANNITNWFGSPGGQGITNAVGAGLSAYGAFQSDGANRKQNASQVAAQQAQQDYWNRQGQNTQRASGVLAADPLGADQRYAQHNALLSAILPNLRNMRSQPGDADVAAAMGASRGGVMNALPTGGLGPETTNLFGPQATMAAITQRHQELSNLDPNAPTADLGSLYGAENAAPYVQQMQQWAQAAQSADANERQAYEQRINALIQQQAQKDKPGGFWHKLAQVAGMVGGIAAMAIPGLQPVGALAIGAASGAAGAWGRGGNPLMGAIVGGATSGLPGMGGARAATAAPNFAGNNASRLFSNVRF